MARGIATCTCKTCGGTFEKIEFRQNRAAADSWVEWAESYYDECTACYKERQKAKRDEENRKAAELAAEANLPELSGTERQVAWANTIRQQVIDFIDGQMDKAIKHMARDKEDDLEDRVKSWEEGLDMMARTREYIVSTYTRASWWIDHRDESYQVLCSKLAKEAEKAAKNVIPDDVAAETTVGPENQTHTGSVTIVASERTIKAEYKKDEDFRKIVKGLGYSWNREQGAWTRTLASYEEDEIPDRTAELGCVLLNKGFAITIQDEEIRRKAVEGDYEPEKTRKICILVSGDYAGKLYIKWSKEDDLYSAARRLPQSKYCRPGIVVPISEYAAVEDFACIYDFRLSPGALEAIQKEKDRIMPVTPAPAPVAEYDEMDLKAILNQPAGILDDLRDD